MGIERIVGNEGRQISFATQLANEMQFCVMKVQPGNSREEVPCIFEKVHIVWVEFYVILKISRMRSGILRKISVSIVQTQHFGIISSSKTLPYLGCASLTK